MLGEHTRGGFKSTRCVEPLVFSHFRLALGFDNVSFDVSLDVSCAGAASHELFQGLLVRTGGAMELVLNRGGKKG
jgi:hypothetical protein